ncbi:MAG: AsnC family transcriptional regulator [Deltaproteobacteria bacterium]|nr:AsnC family transcriptional regulator [Deltaproteobacteria bacterium]
MPRKKRHMDCDAAMDALDRKILTMIQEALPLVSEPYEALGRQIGISGEEVLIRLKRLKETGVIRRIGAVFDGRALGQASTLCAAKVPSGLVKLFVDRCCACRGVTHCYRRNHEYNIWFTVTAPSRDEIDAFLDNLSEETGVKDIRDMPAVRRFKIKATFPL